MRVALLLGTLLFTSACGGAGETRSPVEAPTAKPQTLEAGGEERSWIHWRDEERGFTVTYPARWQRAALRLTPHLSDPVELLALGTYELRPGGDRCAHQAVNAVEDLGPRDALIVIFERAPPYAVSGYPPRQGTANLTGGTGRFCVPGRNRLDAWLPFGESGRAFYALLTLGGDASEETHAQLLAVFESIDFDRS